MGAVLRFFWGHIEVDLQKLWKDNQLRLLGLNTRWIATGIIPALFTMSEGLYVPASLISVLQSAS